jgi:hypothetical protein
VAVVAVVDAVDVAGTVGALAELDQCAGRVSFGGSVVAASPRDASS